MIWIRTHIWKRLCSNPFFAQHMFFCWLSEPLACRVDFHLNVHISWTFFRKNTSRATCVSCSFRVMVPYIMKSQGVIRCLKHFCVKFLWALLFVNLSFPEVSLICIPCPNGSFRLQMNDFLAKMTWEGAGLRPAEVRRSFFWFLSAARLKSQQQSVMAIAMRTSERKIMKSATAQLYLSCLEEMFQWACLSNEISVKLSLLHILNRTCIRSTTYNTILQNIANITDKLCYHTILQQ